MTIREIRLSLGMSQRKFSEYFNIPVTNIQHWEQGVSKPPVYVVEMMERIIDLEQRCNNSSEGD